MRRMVAFGLIAASHFALTIVLVIFTFGAGMARFDTLDGSHWTETLASSVVDVLVFPVLPLLDRPSLRFPGLSGYVPFIVNSVVWAGAIITIWRLRHRLSGRFR
jgi:hypothetical protein